MTVIHGAVPLVHDYLAHSARRVPDKVALVCGKQRVTYRELEQQANALAHALVARGVTRGDRVFVFADNSLETVVSFWAVLKANAVVSIINPLTKAEKLAFLIKDCQPAVLIAAAHLLPAWGPAARNTSLRAVLVPGALDPARLDGLSGVTPWSEAVAEYAGDQSPARRNLELDLAAVVYTSGSTGDPKGVMLTHRTMLSAIASISAYLEIREDDVILGVLPLAFNYGLGQLLMSVREGATLVIERSFAFPAQVLESVVREGVTGFPAIPTIFAILAELKNRSEYDFSRVRYVTNAAAALPVKHIEVVKELFPRARLFSMYGQTECNRISYLPPEDVARKPTSIGIAIPNTELWIVDEQDRRVGPHTVGQLVVRGATLMRGYWGKPELTAKKLKPGPVPGELVLYTGDYCRFDEDGYLYFVSRMDDIINTRGEKVAPKEIEAVLYNLPGVKEAAVVGVPDDVLGQAVKAFLVLEQGVSMGEKQIQKACQDKLESFMVPKFVQFVAELPKTDTGKIRKVGLV